MLGTLLEMLTTPVIHLALAGSCVPGTVLGDGEPAGSKTWPHGL